MSCCCCPLQYHDVVGSLPFHTLALLPPPSSPAFAGVAAAFSILSDADKRAGYDRYGETEGNTGGGTGAQSRRSQAYAQYEQEISPEDLFNMFFGFGPGMQMGGGGFRTVYSSDGGRTFRGGGGGGGGAVRGRRPNTPEEEERAAQGQRMASLMQLLPLILMVLFMVFSFQGSSPEVRLYNLTETPEFKVERRTSTMQVTQRLPYYVKEDFLAHTRHDRTVLARIEAQVESEMYTQLQTRCSQENSKRRVLQQQLALAREARKRESLEQALARFSSPGCDAFKTYFPAHV